MFFLAEQLIFPGKSLIQFRSSDRLVWLCCSRRCRGDAGLNGGYV